MYFNNTIHSTTNKKPIYFKNGKISKDEYPMIKGKIMKTIERIINKLNETRENVDIQTGPVYLNDKRGGKNHLILNGLRPCSNRQESEIL